MKKIANLLTNRMVLIGVAILLQVIWFIVLALQFSVQFTYVDWMLRGAAVVLVLVIVNRWSNPAVKLSWTFLILASPLIGITLYILFGKSVLRKYVRKNMDGISKEISQSMPYDASVEEEIKKQDINVYRQSKYIKDASEFQAFKHTATKYYKCGEEMYPEMLAAMREAKHYIFLEYFIISEGYMFETMVDLLAEKVKEGVEVRLIYDDFGCVNTLPHRYYKRLQAKGIKCAAFNPFRPIISVIMNNRDHRKILVVDGKVGFTGGINLADEYINQKLRFGYWKDTGIRIEGEAVWSLTKMFLTMWNTIIQSKEDYSKYLPSVYQEKPFEQDGYVQPYGDSPMDREYIGENVYLNIINKAKDYVYIFTPYLIVDHETLVALCNAAKSGVDVRIVTPGIPDKKMVYLLSQSYYTPLIQAGVKIYQYTPGFIHAKSFVCDDEIATVGTINLDFRSLYLHFECGIWMYRSKAVMQVKEDCLETFACSEEVSLEFSKNRALPIRMIQSLLRLFAPLM